MTSDKKKHFLLRLDQKLYEALSRWAGDELRSINAQIEFLLKDAVRRSGRFKTEESSRRPNTEK